MKPQQIESFDGKRFSRQLVLAQMLALSCVLLFAGQPVSQANASSVTDMLTGKSAAPSATTAAKDGVPLDADTAFLPRLRQTGMGSVEVKFDIAPAHYLYQKRFYVQVSTGTSSANARTSKPRALIFVTPEGRWVEDPTFGRVAIFEQQVLLKISSADAKATTAPATATTATTTTVSSVSQKNNPKKAKAAPNFQAKNVITVISQGCAVAGICFPPHEHRFMLPIAPQTGDFSNTPWILPFQASSLGFSSVRR
jgi:thiol:disulfide interchange protein